MHLWDFALTVYQSDEVKQHCLILQDSYGVDVCLLLGIWWLSNGGFSLSQAECDNLVDSLDDSLQSKTKAIRALRRRVKRVNIDLDLAETTQQLKCCQSRKELGGEWYRAILDLELASERIALSRIEQFAAERWGLKWSATMASYAHTAPNVGRLQEHLSHYLQGKQVPQRDIDAVSQCLLEFSDTRFANPNI